TIQPQQVKIVASVKTLSNVQKLLGVISWVRPLLGITTEDLHPLFMMLKGEPDLASP
ncbi:POK6 protein, partial [Fregata magnificens]|nr:POK6 protein [Fregata magnificens]